MPVSLILAIRNIFLLLGIFCWYISNVTLPPSGVYFMALDKIFVYICLIRSGSANISGYIISCFIQLISKFLPSCIC